FMIGFFVGMRYGDIMRFSSPMKAIGLSSTRTISKSLAFWLALFLVPALCMKVGAQQNSEAAAMSRVAGGSALSDDTRYRIGPGDVLSIFVRKAPELSMEAVRVDQRGMISI